MVSSQPQLASTRACQSILNISTLVLVPWQEVQLVRASECIPRRLGAGMRLGGAGQKEVDRQRNVNRETGREGLRGG